MPHHPFNGYDPQATLDAYKEIWDWIKTKVRALFRGPDIPDIYPASDLDGLPSVNPRWDLPPTSAVDSRPVMVKFNMQDLPAAGQLLCTALFMKRQPVSVYGKPVDVVSVSVLDLGLLEVLYSDGSEALFVGSDGANDL